jgi:hypothetical protein
MQGEIYNQTISALGFADMYHSTERSYHDFSPDLSPSQSPLPQFKQIKSKIQKGFKIYIPDQSVPKLLGSGQSPMQDEPFEPCETLKGQGSLGNQISLESPTPMLPPEEIDQQRRPIFFQKKDNSVRMLHETSSPTLFHEQSNVTIGQGSTNF